MALRKVWEKVRMSWKHNTLILQPVLGINGCYQSTRHQLPAVPARLTPQWQRGNVMRCKLSGSSAGREHRLGTAKPSLLNVRCDNACRPLIRAHDVREPCFR